jgi:hypothetical protein
VLGGRFGEWRMRFVGLREKEKIANFRQLKKVW